MKSFWGQDIKISTDSFRSLFWSYFSISYSFQKLRPLPVNIKHIIVVTCLFSYFFKFHILYIYILHYVDAFKFSLYDTLLLYLHPFTDPYSIAQNNEIVRVQTSIAGPNTPSKVSFHLCCCKILNGSPLSSHLKLSWRVSMVENNF